MLRPTAPADTPALLALADATGMFKPHEIVALREVLDDYHATNRDEGHVAATWDDAGTPLGFVYYAPAAMTDRTWDLWWIAVDKTRQGRGLGKALLDAVEADVRERGGRLLLIETSSTPHYEPTRQFYLKRGYVIAATVPDYYADGDGKVIFWKRVGSGL